MPKQVPKECEETKEPKKKKPKKAMNLDAKYAYFLQTSVVGGKVMKIDYFKEQGLGCSWISWKLRAGHSCLQTLIGGVLCLT